MRSALESVAGVEQVDVDFSNKTARVTCADDCDTAGLVAALKEAGFGGSVQ